MYASTYFDSKSSGNVAYTGRLVGYHLSRLSVRSPFEWTSFFSTYATTGMRDRRASLVVATLYQYSSSLSSLLALLNHFFKSITDASIIYRIFLTKARINEKNSFLAGKSAAMHTVRKFNDESERINLENVINPG